MKKQQGVAIIVVLLVVALVSVIATDLTARLQRETRRSSNIFDHEQALQYVSGLEQLAVLLLKQHKAASPERADLSQPWATRKLHFPVEGGELTGTLKDRNSCFNLNSLVLQQDEGSYVVDNTAIAYVLYRRLLEVLGLPISLSEPLADWLDSDKQARGLDGAEDSVYEAKDPSYRAANTLMLNKSELYLLEGYSKEIVKKLSPYVCALPEAGYLHLNVNTLEAGKPELLMMLIKNLDAATATAVLATRKDKGYASMDEFWQQDVLAGLEIVKDAKPVLQLNSGYFYLQASSKIGRGYAGLTALLTQNGEGPTDISWRRFGRIE